MKFIVVFHYMDGEDFEIEVHSDDMQAFMDTLSKSECYFNNSRGLGVWIPIDKIRYFHVEKVDEKGRRVVESDSKILDNNGKLEEREPEDPETGEGGVDGAVPAA